MPAAETAAAGKVLLEEDSAYRLVGKKLFEKFHEEDFEEMYSNEGKPGISPIILVFITVFQFMEKLPDGSENKTTFDKQRMLRLRMDCEVTATFSRKYALHLP